MPFRSPRRSPGRSLVIGVVGVVLLAGIVVLVLPAVLGVLGTAGSVVGSLLPWLAVLLIPVAVIALGTRSKRLALLSVAFVAAWAFAILPGVLVPAASGPAQLSIVTENVEAANTDPAATARSIASRKPDVIALEELTADSGTAVSGVLDERYPHHYRVGSIGVWSRTALSDGEPMTLGLGWARALRVTVDTELGDVRLYVVHMDSLRLGGEDGRPTMLTALATAVRADGAARLVVAGDFNGGSKDPKMLPLTGMLDEGGGFGFTWPAQLPVVRIDHVFVRGLDTTSTEVLPANGSDHRGLEVGVRAG